MDDPVRLAAQTTIDAIDKELARLSAAREALVNLFGLGVRVPLESLVTLSATPEPPKTVVTPTPTPPQAPDAVTSGNSGYTPVNYVCHSGRERGRTQEMYARWDELRVRALRELGEGGGDMKRSVLRKNVGIAVRQVPQVFEHEWFQQTMGRVLLTAAGRVELERQKAGATHGERNSV